MSFLSCEEMLAAARSQKITLAEAVLRSDLEESRLTEEQSRAAMRHLWQVMQATSWEYDPAQRSRSGLSGGDAAKVELAHKEGKLLGGDYLSAVTAEALKTAECNACMKRIVAAPTAGSCGVLPAVLLPLARAGEADEEAVCEALYVAAGFGQVIAARATLAGAEGGCQAEVGAASAMAAAALCSLKGGTPEQCAAAAAMALGNLLRHYRAAAAQRKAQGHAQGSTAQTGNGLFHGITPLKTIQKAIRNADATVWNEKTHPGESSGSSGTRNSRAFHCRKCAADGYRFMTNFRTRPWSVRRHPSGPAAAEMQSGRAGTPGR